MITINLWSLKLSQTNFVLNMHILKIATEQHRVEMHLRSLSTPISMILWKTVGQPLSRRRCGVGGRGKRRLVLGMEGGMP